MAEITSISLERMNNGAHFLFHTDVVALIDADTKVKEKVPNPLIAYRAALLAEDNALKISQKSLLTDDLTAADLLRGKLYIGTKQNVKSYLSMPDPALSQAAKVLDQLFKDYAISTDMQLDKETGLLINLIADLENKYKSQVTALGLTPLVASLKTANESVRKLTADRLTEQVSIVVGATKATRKATDTAYQEIIKIINAYAIIEGDADYLSIINYMNKQIVHYKREVIGQKTAATNPADKPSSGNEPGGGSGEKPDDL